MNFQADPDRIVWRLHLASPPEDVYEIIDSDDGRAGFWSESAVEVDGSIHFRFINGVTYDGRILERVPPSKWAVEYFGSAVEFQLESDGAGGTDLTLIDAGVADEFRGEVTAGWLNVLLPLKAFVDFGADLHNHDPNRSWDQGYVDH